MMLSAYALRTQCPVLRSRMVLQMLQAIIQVSLAICLRTSYAMSGTDIAYGDIHLRTCYAMSGTDIADSAVCLRACYAMSGTDLGYAATRNTS
eukprot:288128-Rhodomonas_salina.2